MKPDKDNRRKGFVYNNDVLAGIIEEVTDGFRYTYDTTYLADPSSDAISLTLPKSPHPYTERHLFAFFYGLLAEGPTRQLQCLRLGLREQDYFGLLLATAHSDVIGSVTVRSSAEPDGEATP